MVDVEVLVVLEVVVVVEVVVVTSGVMRVTGKSLVSIICVEAMEELRNLEVILLTCFLVVLGLSVTSAEIGTSEMVGFGVIGILLMTVVGADAISGVTEEDSAIPQQVTVKCLSNFLKHFSEPCRQTAIA